MTDPTPLLCPSCGSQRSWVWSTRHERMVLRACPCHAPAGDRTAARERIASIRHTLRAKREDT